MAERSATTIVPFNASSVEDDNETIFSQIEIGGERGNRMEMGKKIRAVEFVFRWEYILFRMQIPVNIVREPYLILCFLSFFFFLKD